MRLLKLLAYPMRGPGDLAALQQAYASCSANLISASNLVGSGHPGFVRNWTPEEAVKFIFDLILPLAKELDLARLPFLTLRSLG